MDETASGLNREAGQHRPYWIVGFALFGLVALVLVLAFVLNRQLQPHVGIAPIGTGSPVPPSPTPQRHTGGSTRSTSMPATPVAVTPTSTTTPMPTARPTPTLPPRQQVMQAYHRYWQAYSQALYNLDTSPMSAVAVGNELTRVQTEVAALRQNNHAVHVRVSHSVLIVSVKGDKATLYDEQHDRSFLINPATKEPHNGSVQPFVEKDIYFMQKIDGTWKVVRSLRQR